MLEFSLLLALVPSPFVTLRRKTSEIMADLKMTEFRAEPRGAAARFRRRQNGDDEDDDVDADVGRSRMPAPKGAARNGTAGIEKEALLEDKRVRRRKISESEELELRKRIRSTK